MDAAGNAGRHVRIPLDVLRDTISPLPTFSEIDAFALKALRAEMHSAPQPAGEARDEGGMEAPRKR